MQDRINRIIDFINRLKNDLFDRESVFYESEVQGNLLVAKTMLFECLLLLVALLMAYSGVFDLDLELLRPIVIQGLFELIVPSVLCFILKGKPKWLKIVLLLFLSIVNARIDSVLTYTVPFVMIISTILSIRYYSRTFTQFISAITIILSGVSCYFATYYGMGLVDLNVINIPIGTHIEITSPFLSQSILSASPISPQALWEATFRYSYLPKLLVFILVAVISCEIAEKGRLLVLKQDEQSRNSERIATELDLASNIQTNMLPNIFPPFPERQDFDVYASMHAAKEVGGDFYDFFMIDDKHLAIVIADVSGKGVPAAMFMVIVKTLIKDHMQLGLKPEDVFYNVNNTLCENNDAGMFATSWLGLINLETGEVDYVNAGHNPPVVVKNNEVFFLKEKPCFILAGLENMKYRVNHLTLSYGDRIFLYTDGITEAINEKKEMFGNDRLLQTIKNNITNKNVDVLENVTKEVNKFVGKEEQFDDQTMLIFDYTFTDCIRKLYRAEDTLLPDVIDFVQEKLSERKIANKIVNQVAIVVEELFVNVAHYAYDNREETGDVELIMEFKNDSVYITFIDSGVQFNPLQQEDPDITLSAEERDIGGLGIYMIKKMMDSVEYKFENNHNVLTISKKIK